MHYPQDLSYSEIQEALDSSPVQDLPRYRIAVLRTVTLEAIEPYLRYYVWQGGLNAEIRFGQFDNLVQEAMTGGVLDSGTDCVLVFSPLESLSPRLARRHLMLSDQELREEAKQVNALFATVLAGIRRQSDAMVLWHGLEQPTSPSLGILDPQSDRGLGAIVHSLNDGLRKLLHDSKNAFFVNMDACLMRTGAGKFYDRRYWHLAKSPWSREGLQQIAFEDSKFIAATKGRTKKCLVLDCDNVLWGGIVGEDSLTGIALGKTYPGSCFLELQQEVLNLRHRGILIALCSKNNEADVWEVFRSHPEMLLKEEHIVAAQINWNDKASNLRQIAKTLNIGLDSLVFADDSEFEIHGVRELAPEVATLLLPKRRPEDYRDHLASCGFFDVVAISNEDSQRSAMYKADESRKLSAAQFSDLTSYYRSLEMVVTIAGGDEKSIPRIAQLTQKTNQFNLTTKRYTEGDIRRFTASKDFDVFSLRMSDRFGDLGTVGVAILVYSGDVARIDSLLLSCRVLGRTVEDVFLSTLIRHVQKRGCVKISAHYHPTAKNEQVKDFYEKQRFTRLTADSVSSAYDLYLANFEPPLPDYFKQIDFKPRES